MPLAPDLTSGLAATATVIAAQQGPQPAAATVAALAGLRLMGASAHRGRGDLDAALADLGRALRAGVPAGYCRLLLDEGPEMVELLRTAARNSDLPGSEEAAALLQAAERGHTPPRPPTPVGQEPLSEREVEVLRLLATTLTGPEIADQLFMSVHTFRTHTRHIFHQARQQHAPRRGQPRRRAELALTRLLKTTSPRRNHQPGHIVM